MCQASGASGASGASLQRSVSLVPQADRGSIPATPCPTFKGSRSQELSCLVLSCLVLSAPVTLFFFGERLVHVFGGRCLVAAAFCGEWRRSAVFVRRLEVHCPMGSALLLVGGVRGRALLDMSKCVFSGGSVAALGVVVLVVRCHLWLLDLSLPPGLESPGASRVFGEEEACHLGCHINQLAGSCVPQGQVHEHNAI